MRSTWARTSRGRPGRVTPRPLQRLARRRPPPSQVIRSLAVTTAALKASATRDRRPPAHSDAGPRWVRAAPGTAGPRRSVRDTLDLPDLPAKGDDVGRLPDELERGRLVQPLGDDGEGAVPSDLHQGAGVRQRGRALRVPGQEV